MKSKEYWQVVAEGIQQLGAGAIEPRKIEIEGMKLKDLKGKKYLFQAIDRSILETIHSNDTSKHIWDSMRRKYQGPRKTKRQKLHALHTEFETLKMKFGESVTY